MPQFRKLDCSRGAPMGRYSSHNMPTEKKSVRVFKVKLDKGGYDDGGAYWGLHSKGPILYCATDDKDYLQFCRASSRMTAVVEFGIPAAVLKQGVKAEYAQLKYLENKGSISASGITLRQKLDELGYGG